LSGVKGTEDAVAPDIVILRLFLPFSRLERSGRCRLSGKRRRLKQRLLKKDGVVLHHREELEAGLVLQCEPKQGIRTFNAKLAADIGAVVLHGAVVDRQFFTDFLA
jgi:hypothetical protein